MIKYTKTLAVITLVAFAAFFNSCKGKKTISISGAFALHPLAVKWSQEYMKLHPEIKIDVSSGGTGKGISDVLSGNAEIGMVSREINPAETEKGAWPLAVSKDAVVATVNTSNPYIKTILEKGIKKEGFEAVWITGKAKQWSDIISDSSATNHVQIYKRSDAAGAPEVWAKYLGKKQEDLLGVGVFGDPGLADAVKKDPNGIGFNNLAFVYNISTKKPYEGLLPVPIDVNNNGTIDSTENFYGSMDLIIEAINKGAYPSPPARDLYFITKGKPTDPAVTEFLKWVLTDGQQYVEQSGYVKLPDSQLQPEINKLK
ncbi:MAG: PstS family phosphate ABC transporter substrate-binding protein [Cytophagaceae bacterium]